MRSLLTHWICKFQFPWFFSRSFSHHYHTVLHQSGLNSVLFNSQCRSILWMILLGGNSPWVSCVSVCLMRGTNWTFFELSFQRPLHIANSLGRQDPIFFLWSRGKPAYNYYKKICGSLSKLRFLSCNTTSQAFMHNLGSSTLLLCALIAWGTHICWFSCSLLYCE